MILKAVTAAEARRLAAQGALLVDIREPGEYLGENIPGALNAPLSRLGETPVGAAAAVVFYCKSGARTRMNAEALAASTDAEAYILDGGIEAWKAAGYPVSPG
ncbi:MAG: rhodanese-like domain-containing protein [Aestuariivirga sp.]|uniref:rhodanese-like domain-containing protein n=1 Tax=Aestuariivirga sp. TaxID=2650926 RepID=UPI0038D125F3